LQTLCVHRVRAALSIGTKLGNSLRLGMTSALSLYMLAEGPAMTIRDVRVCAVARYFYGLTPIVVITGSCEFSKVTCSGADKHTTRGLPNSSFQTIRPNRNSSVNYSAEEKYEWRCRLSILTLHLLF